MKKYYDFINEDKDRLQTVLYLHPTLYDLLREDDFRDLPISRALLANNSKMLVDISFINTTLQNDMVSYITATKTLELIKDKDKITDIRYLLMTSYHKLSESKLRQTVKVGRLIKMLFGDMFSSIEIEEFVNKYKARMLDMYSRFELVEGEDIRKWYSCRKYTPSDKGTLNFSCMKYDEINKFLDIYVYHKEGIKMLILKDKENDDKIIGRALVWKLSYPIGMIYMDKIYYNDECITELFKKYATENGWAYKSQQSSALPCKIVYHGIVDTKMEFQLEKTNFDYYPYLDTLAYLNFDNNTLTNIIPDNYYMLRSQDGGFSNYRIDE